MKYLIVGFFSALLLVSCSVPAKRYSLSGFAQGSTYSIVYYADTDVIRKEFVDSLLDAFSSSCSVFDTTSLLSRINRGLVDTVDVHIKRCLALADELHELSGGLYDITSYPLSKAHGFLRDDVEANISIDSLMQFIGQDKIQLVGNKIVKSDARVAIDLNSVAQGYSVDLLSEYIKSEGVSNFIVEIGGEVYCSGIKDDGSAWKIGIDRPKDGNNLPGDELQAIIDVKDRGVNTSGNYRKFYTDDKGERVNHIVNPLTGKSCSNNMLSATVISSTTAYSDGLATVLMLVGEERAQEILKDLRKKDVQGYLVYHQDDSIKVFSTINH